MRLPRPQFSLRPLLFAVTAFGLWLPWHMERARMQEKVVRRLHGTWGHLAYDYEVGKPFGQARAASRSWPISDQLRPSGGTNIGFEI